MDRNGVTRGLGMANPSPLIAAAGIYLVTLWPLVRLVAYLEKRNA